MSTTDVPLTVLELRDQLDLLLASRPLAAAMPVAFGPKDADTEIVAGGILRRDHLLLAGMKLDGVGGF